MHPATHITLSGDRFLARGRQPWWIAVPVRLAGGIGLLTAVPLGIFALMFGLLALQDKHIEGVLLLLAACLYLFWVFTFWKMIRLRFGALAAACGGAWISVLGAAGAYFTEGSHIPAVENLFMGLGLQFPPTVAMLIGLANWSSPPPRVTFQNAAFFLAPALLIPTLFLSALAAAWRDKPRTKARDVDRAS